ncbi:MAG: T9SS type A sorting domain-containing protein [candidate division Zixibacteria bacterium]|nr:T9SS type A sorting domain-containing protein [candidate division Zixibacteria bacterium]
MKLRLIVTALMLLTLMSTSVLADIGDTLWTGFYGLGDTEAAYSVKETLDKGFIIAGFSTSYNYDNKDFYLVRTDADGDTLWTRTYGGNFDDVALSVAATDDGCFIVAGWTKSFGAGGTDFYLVKTDPQGDTMWTRTYGSPFEDTAKCVQQTADGGYVICGTTDYNDYQHDDFDVYVIKTDAHGEIDWTYHSGGVVDDGANCIIQTSNGDYMISGYTACAGGNNNIYVEKISSFGTNIWYWGFHPGSDNMAYSIVEASDGDYVVAGRTFDHYNAVEFYLMKISNNGSVLWERTFGDSHCELGYSIDRTPDDGYIIGGAKWISFWPDTTQFYLVKTDSEGNMLWDRTYMYGGLDEGSCVISTSDDHYAFAGYSNWMGPYNFDYCLMKIEGTGTTDIKSDDLAAPASFRLESNYPNPFNAATIIKYELSEPADVTLEIYDILGRKITTLINYQQSAGYHQAIWNADDLPSGMYFYKLQTKNCIETMMMTLLK